MTGPEGPRGRSRDEVYDDLLRFQAELSFDLEVPFFRLSPKWGTASNVLDLGAGNCYYTRLLAQRFPDKRFVAVEPDGTLTARAAAWIRPYHIDVVSGTVADLPREILFDFVLARHVLSYVDDLEELLDWFAYHTAEDAGLLVLDADDGAFATQPRLPLLERGNEEFKAQVDARGGDRGVIDRVIPLMATRGFAHLWTRQLAVHSDIRDRKYLMLMFMTSVAELDHGSPLPATLRIELDQWSRDPKSFLQYGIVAASFRRITKA